MLSDVNSFCFYVLLVHAAWFWSMCYLSAIEFVCVWLIFYLCLRDVAWFLSISSFILNWLWLMLIQFVLVVNWFPLASMHVWFVCNWCCLMLIHFSIYVELMLLDLCYVLFMCCWFELKLIHFYQSVLDVAWGWLTVYLFVIDDAWIWLIVINC